METIKTGYEAMLGTRSRTNLGMRVFLLVADKWYDTDGELRLVE